MTRWSLVLLFCFALASALAGGQPIPPDIKTGADFLWYVANSNEATDVYAFKSAVIAKDKDVQDQVLAAHSSLVRLRGTFVPAVDVIKQFYLERGEQRTIYRIQSNMRGSKFFEVHILGSNRPPMIIGIRELDSGKVVELLTAKSMLTVPQRK